MNCNAHHSAIRYVNVQLFCYVITVCIGIGASTAGCGLLSRDEGFTRRPRSYPTIHQRTSLV